MKQPTLDEIREQYQDGRRHWNVDVTQALNGILTFGSAVGAALGDISRDEAIDAMKKYAADAFEALR